MRAFRYILPVLVVLSGCRKESVPVSEVNVPIRFSAGVTVSVESKAGAGSFRTTAANVKSRPFAFHAIYGTEDRFTSGTALFEHSGEDPVAVWTDAPDSYGSSGYWNYGEDKYWKMNRYYRFRAYHPSDGKFTPDGDADLMRIEYSVVRSQDDLCVAFADVHASASYVADNDGKVNLKFRHALSALRFRVRIKDDSPRNEEIIERLYLTGLSPTGTLLFGHQNDDVNKPRLVWYTSYFDAVDRYYEWNGSKAYGKSTSKNACEVFDGDGIVFAIPQTIREGKTVVHFKTGSSVDEETVLLKPGVWEPGMVYTYTLVVGEPSVSVEIDIKPWKDLDASVDIYI